ncbi:TPA: hypothetical protein EYP66_22165 [Candidatus Poribacteria bacterium]|nr:hypothetical protein [Candidatus Poribacteria bacterium]
MKSVDYVPLTGLKLRRIWIPYQDAGVLEYWLIDPLQRRAEFYRLHENCYELVPFERNRIFRSTAMEGFWLDVEWLFAEPLPKSYEKLQEILGNL